VDEDPLVARSLSDKYIAALYFATATMTTMGYGDIGPVTTAERGVVAFMMFIGALLYALVLSNVNTLMAAMEAQSRKYTNLVDSLNVFLEERAISADLRYEARRYLRTRDVEGNLVSYHGLLHQLSPDIQQAVAGETHRGWCQGSRYLHGAEEDFEAKSASNFAEITFPAGESIIERGEPVDRLLVIKKGLVGCFGRVLNAGDVLGDETIIDERRKRDEGGGGYRAAYVATALTFTVIDSLPLASFEEVIAHFPGVRKRAQKRLNCAIMRAHCWAYASAVLEGRGRKPLRGAWDRDLVDFYSWKVSWFQVKGLDAVRLFRSVLCIQRVARGYIQRRHLGKSKESGIGAVQLMAKHVVSVAVEELYRRVVDTVGVEGVVARAKVKERERAEERRILELISHQIKNLAARVAMLEEERPETER